MKAAAKELSSPEHACVKIIMTHASREPFVTLRSASELE